MKCARHVDLRMPMCFFPLRLVTAYPTFSAHRSRYLLNIFRCEKAEEQSGMLEPRPLASSCLTSHFAHPSHLPPTTVRKNNIRERIQDGREFSEKISKSHSTINRQTLNFVIDNQNWNLTFFFESWKLKLKSILSSSCYMQWWGLDLELKCTRISGNYS